MNEEDCSEIFFNNLIQHVPQRLLQEMLRFPVLLKYSPYDIIAYIKYMYTGNLVCKACKHKYQNIER